MLKRQHAALRPTVRAPRGLRFPRDVSRNVLALWFTSLLTDVSSKMVATVLPIYLVLHLGLTPLRLRRAREIPTRGCAEARDPRVENINRVLTEPAPERSSTIPNNPARWPRTCVE